MADRFAGTVYIGGRISQEIFEKVAEVVNECGVDGDLEEDGSAYFSECNFSHLGDLVKYCDLEEHPCMFIRDFINKMEVPDFPNLEIEE